MPVNRGLQMARRLLHTSRAHMESCLFRELKKSAPPCFLCLITAMSQTPLLYLTNPLNLSHATSRRGASDRNTCSRNCSFFLFCSFFLPLLVLFPSPVHGSGVSEGQSRGKVHPNVITSALPQVSMLPGSCSPSRPCGRLCVSKCVIQQRLQEPCPVCC